MLPKCTAPWMLVLSLAPLHAIELRKDVVGSFGVSSNCVPGMFHGMVYDLLPETNSLPKFEKLKPTGTVCSFVLNIPTRSFMEGIPGVTTRIEWFAIDYTADFWIDTPGAYMFTLASDDGSRLYIDGKSIIDNDGHHATIEMAGRAKLEPGLHHMRVSYFQGPREYVALVLKVAPPHGNFEIFDLRAYRPHAAEPAVVSTNLIDDARPVLRRSTEAHDPLAAKAYELSALAALAATPRPRDFDAYARVFRFRSTECAIALEVPAMGLTATPSNGGARLHLVVLALIKDAQGNVIRKFSEDFPVELSAERLAALKSATLSWHRSLTLPEGVYTIETVAVDREGNRSSAASLQVDNSAKAGAVGLSDPILVQRIETVAAEAVNAGDPFQSQGKRVVPELTGVVAAEAHPSVYFAIYPNPKNQEKPRITIELTLDGQLAGRQTSELPASADASGAIPITIAAPAQPGKNRLRITIHQGTESVQRDLEYTIAASR